MELVINNGHECYVDKRDRLALFLIKTELPSSRTNRFIMLYHRSLSTLAEAKIKKLEGKPYDEEAKKVSLRQIL